MYNNKTVTAVLLAAGSGTRMGQGINKIFLPLPPHAAPGLLYPLAALEKNPFIDEIYLVVRREDGKCLQDIILHEKFPRKPVWVVAGGHERSDSVRNALQRIQSDIVLLADGARPLLKQRYITGCLQAMESCEGAVIGVPCIDTVCTVDDTGCLLRRFDRRGLYQLQTPQCFHTAILKECHERVQDKSAVTDDSALLEQCGYRVKILPGDYANIKLTVPADAQIAGLHIENDEEIAALL